MYPGNKNNEAISLLQEGRSVSEVFEITLVSKSILYKWKNELITGVERANSSDYNSIDVPGLAEQLLEEDLDSIESLEKLLEIAKRKDQPYIKEILLRRLLELKPGNIDYEIDLAKSLVKQYNRSTPKHYKIARKSEKLNEARELLQGVDRKEPDNLIAISFLRIIASLQFFLDQEIVYLEKMISIDQEDLSTKKRLDYIIAYRNKLYTRTIFTDYGSKANSPENQNPIQNFEQQIIEMKSKTDKPSFAVLYEHLMRLLDKGWNRELISEVLKQMLDDETLDQADRGKIRAMIDKTNSKQRKMAIILRGNAISLSKKR